MGDLLCIPFVDSVQCAVMFDDIPGPGRLLQDLGHMPPCFPAPFFGLLTALGPGCKERFAGSMAYLLPRHQGSEASLSLAEQSLPGRQRLHPTRLRRCAGELTAAPQACPAHLIIHSSTTLPPNPGLEDKSRACGSQVTEPPSASCPALLLLSSTS